jgi:hypothetical protein
VLFIGALLISGVAQYLTAQITAAKISATRSKQDAIKIALVSYISRNNQLPCPARADLPNGDPNNGRAVLTCTVSAAGIIVSGAGPTAVANGAVPWVSLGLSNESSIDGYSNRFTYQVFVDATSLTKDTIAGMKGAITIHNAGPAAGANQTNDCTPAGWTYNPCIAVVVIVSHGQNGAGAYNDTGTQLAPPAGADELENTNADNKFVVKTFSGATANPYDDIVMALTANDLLSPLTSGGGMQDSRAALSANFNVIKNALIANATRVGSYLCVAGSCAGTTNCGVSAAPPTPATPCEVTQYTYTLPASAVASGVATLPSIATTDPWNIAIQYRQITPSITPLTNGSFKAFTLKSWGPNTVDDSPSNPNACTGDDICMDVYVSEFQSLAAKFR